MSAQKARDVSTPTVWDTTNPCLEYILDTHPKCGTRLQLSPTSISNTTHESAKSTRIAAATRYSHATLSSQLQLLRQDTRTSRSPKRHCWQASITFTSLIIDMAASWLTHHTNVFRAPDTLYSLGSTSMRTTPTLLQRYASAYYDPLCPQRVFEGSDRTHNRTHVMMRLPGYQKWRIKGGKELKEKWTSCYVS